MSKGQVQRALSSSEDHAELWKEGGNLLLSPFLAQRCRHRHGHLQVGQPEEGLLITSTRETWSVSDIKKA